MLLSAEGRIVLNWDLTPISSPLLVEASLDRKPSNESTPFTRRGERGWVADMKRYK
jgi:hypothetical protein